MLFKLKFKTFTLNVHLYFILCVYIGVYKHRTLYDALYM